MLAITIRPPMSHAVMHLGKNIENRANVNHWRRITGSRVAVHAGKRWEQGYVRDIEAITGRRLDQNLITVGAIIGTVTFSDIHWADSECCDPWGQYEFGGTVAHLVLDRPRACDPIPCKGALGLWTVPDDIARELAAVSA